MGLVDDVSREPLTPPALRDELRDRWEALDEEKQQDLERVYFQLVVWELSRDHRLAFVADVAWPETREELRRVGAVLGLDVESHGGRFSGQLVPAIADVLVNTGNVLLEVFDPDELVMYIGDDLNSFFLYLTEPELQCVRDALGAAGFMV
jgi:hypothetical protein